MKAAALAASSMLLAWLAASCGGSSSSTGTGGSSSASSSGTSPSSSSGATSTSSSSTGSGGAASSSSGSSSSGAGGTSSPSCANAGVAICESFEGAANGQFPANWGDRGDDWGDGTMGVTDEDAYRGKKSFKVTGGKNGQRFMDYKGALGGLATTHYGRVFFKVKTWAWPASGVLHGDLVEGLGPHPGGGTNNVRWGIVENTQQKYQWIFNVQPDQGEPEFGEGTNYDYSWGGQWQCLEWFYDATNQKGTLWIDKMQMPIVPGTSHPAEIPVFKSLGVGWANYQDASTPFEVFYDELAFDTARITCDK